MADRCPASEGETCRLVVAFGTPCDGWSDRCGMRRELERRYALADAIAENVRRAFGIEPSGGQR